MRLRGRTPPTGTRVDVTCAEGQIVSIAPAGHDRVDREAAWIVPGYFDLQVNGGAGISFNSATLDECQILKVVDLHARHGVTGMLPTVITNAPQAMFQAFQALSRARDRNAGISAFVPGYHLEGPWISPDDGYRGAHPREHVRLPDWDTFSSLQTAAGGLIRVVTLAPELPGALAFIEKLTKWKVIVALGHTAASAETIADAVRAGARISTHLGNGIAATLPRHANPIWGQLARDDMWASVIADGHHLTPAVLKCILRVKGIDRTILVSDASSLAGMPPGQYREWDQDIEVTSDGKITVAGTPYLAGSGAFLDQCVEQVVASGVSAPDAVAMASDRPRELLGLRNTNRGLLMLDERGRIEHIVSTS